MALVLTSDLDPQQLAARVAAFAAGKVHKLQGFQVDGRNPLTPAAADGIMRYLSRCPDRPPADQAQERDIVRRNPVSTTEETRRRANFQDIPAGFYATRKDPEGQADFWKVTVGKGDRRYVKRVVGGGDAQQPELKEMTWPQMTAALKAVLAGGITESAALYAELEVRCIRCGRQLTDEISQQFMMGDKCRGKSQ